MNIDWSAYRITLVLYLGIILLPLVFYFSYISLTELQEDTKVINDFTFKSALLVQKDSDTERIVNEFSAFKPWMQKNDNTIFYVGNKPLAQKYEDLMGCIKSQGSCFKQAHSIIFSLNNILSLKQNRIYNIFYVDFFIAIALLIALVFLTRIYTHKQLVKHYLYDFKTNLYTRDYMLSALKVLGAQMQRENKPFSLLYMSVDKINDTVLEFIGRMLLDELRESDVACRYSDDKFIVLLPNTEHTNVSSLMQRLEKHLKDMHCWLKVLEYKNETNYEALLDTIEKEKYAYEN